MEAHREEITLHKAAKAAFDEAGLQKLPKVKELDAEFAELLTKKKAAYPDYRKVRNDMQEMVSAQKIVVRLIAKEKNNTENTNNIELHIANYYKYFPRDGQENIPDEPDKDGEDTPGGDTTGGKKVWF